MSSKCTRLFRALLISGVFISMASVSMAAQKPAEPAAPPAKKAEPPYSRQEAALSIINPHEQIDDEGHVLTLRKFFVSDDLVRRMKRREGRASE